MLVQEFLCWRWVLFQCQHRHLGFMHFFSVKSDVTKMMLWAAVPELPLWLPVLICSAFAGNDVFTNFHAYKLTVGSNRHTRFVPSSCQLCCAVNNTCKSAPCPYIVVPCPDCSGLQAYHGSRLLLFFILFVLSKLGWWSQWTLITGVEQLSPSFFPIITWIALGSLHLKTSFNW